MEDSIEIKKTQIDILADNALCLTHQLQYGRDELEALCAKLSHAIRNIIPVCDYIENVSDHDYRYKDVKEMFFKILEQGTRTSAITRYTQLMDILTQLKIYMLDLITFYKLDDCDIDKLKLDVNYINKFLP